MSESLPPWVPVPAMPRPTNAGPTYPHVIDQRPQDDGTVLVTFALPGLRRHTVRVPQTVWLNGEHLPIGVHAHRWLDSMLPTPPVTPARAQGDDDSPAS